MTEQELQNFHELLPFYVNKTLSDSDKKFIERCLLEEPKLQEELNFTEHLRTSVKSITSNRSEIAGLDELLKAWHDSDYEEKVSWGLRISDFFSQQATPVFAVLSTVIFVQSFFLVSLNNEKQNVTWLTEDTRSYLDKRNDIRIKLTINPSEKFGDLVVLFQGTGAHITDGPSESGEVWVKLSGVVEFADAIKTIQASPSVIDFVVTNKQEL